MKRIILLLTLVLLASTATAVVGGPEPEDGEMTIMSSGSTASATSAVGPNGTEWSSSVKMQGRNPDISIGDKVENISYSENKTTFSGYIQAPNPCYVINQETKKTGEESYQIDISTVTENNTQVCTQQVVMIEYEGSFEAEAPYTLEIQHNNQTIDTLENKGSGESTEKKNKNFIKTFFGWLSHLF